MTDRRHEALEVCLAALSTGVDLETCLTLYPDLAEELRPALEAAQAAQSARVETIPPQAMRHSRERLLAAGAQLRPRRRFALLPIGLPRAALAALAVTVALLLGWSGLRGASAEALPGDPLYPIKRADENMRLQLSLSSTARRSLESSYIQRRAEEVSSLLGLGRVALVAFEGVVTDQSADRWLVQGIRVFLTPQTKIFGDIQIGMRIEVEGETQAGGWVLAHELRLRSLEIVGVVESIGPQTWRIAGVELQILPNTQIDPGIRVGDEVVVLATFGDEGVLSARAILRMMSAAPTATAPPAPTPAPPPSPTPTQERSPEANEQEVDFTGVVEAIGDNAWTIGGHTVAISGRTEIDDAIEIGAEVSVHALVGVDGSLAAVEISLVQGDNGQEETGAGPKDENGEGKDEGQGDEQTQEGDADEEKEEFTGAVESIGSSVWVIDGEEVMIVAETDIRGDPEVGDTVKVVAFRQSDGTLRAESIERKED
jgi:hypothetical protein